MPRAILVDQLRKRYRLGETQHTMLRDALMSIPRRMFGREKPDSGSWHWALNGVSLEVEQGEAIGVIGSNGAGKSTLLKILSRITRPTSGRMEVRGRVASLLEVGTGFHEELTGRENIYLNGSILGMTRREIESTIDEIVDFADIAGFTDTPIKRYSSGMRMRLGFAVAAHMNPDVLFIDEVLAVGDVQFQKKCLGTMQDLAAGGRTILFVSHNLAAVENLCKRAIWISGGQVRMNGDSREVIRAYLKSTSSSGVDQALDLTKITPRSGTGAARFTRMELTAPDGTPVRAVHSGDSFVIRMEYEAYRDIPHCHFGFRLFSNLGTKLTDLHTWGTGVDIPMTPVGPGSISVEVDFVNLMPGTYYLGIWIASDGGEFHDTLDHVMALEVEPSDFYGSGRGVESRFGLIFFPCRWKPGAPPAPRSKQGAMPDKAPGPLMPA